MISLLQANALHIPLADETVQACVTSPPYWGLRKYAVDGDGELGLEKLHDCGGYVTGQPCGECFICHMVAVFREVRRVLRSDGVCWCNIGDGYASQGGPLKDGGGINDILGGKKETQDYKQSRKSPSGLKPKDLCLIPQRLALALQADGWYVRSEIIWHKPNPMPESCTDRPTKSHEQIWMLTKSARYWYDAEAVKEKVTGNTHRRENGDGGPKRGKDSGDDFNVRKWGNLTEIVTSRNLRDVWIIATQPYPGSHYATYPEELVLRCLKASTSERGACPKCRKQWVRIIEKNFTATSAGRKNITGQDNMNGWEGIPRGMNNVTTLGFRPGCECEVKFIYQEQDTDYGVKKSVIVGFEGNPSRPIPAIVLDPFAGSGTTLQVAKRMGLDAIGLDLSYQYLHDNARARIGAEQERMV